MKNETATDLADRMAAASKGAIGNVLWTNVLADIVAKLFAEKDSITNAEVTAKLRELSEDETAAKLIRDGAAEAFARLTTTSPGKEG